ncbi:MAG: TolC family protein [Fibrobacter sp.]|nr:TolC family protein [Fibrobacter sp.]
MPRCFTIPMTLIGVMAILSSAAESYTREDVIRIALEKSSDVQTAEQEYITANSTVNGAYGNAFPSIDLSAQYARTFGVSDVNQSDAISSMLDNTADMNDRMLAGTLDKMAYGLSALNGFRWGTQVGLTATQILYAQGKVSSGVQIARSYRRVAEYSLENAKVLVRYTAETAFNSVLYLDSAVAIYEASLNQAQKHFDYAKQAYESGLVGELDLIRAELQIDELQSGLEKTKKDQILARNALLNTMGLPWQEDVAFTGDLRDPASSTLAEPDTALKNVLARRKEILQLNESENMQNLNIHIEQGDYKPSLILGGSIAYANGANRWNSWEKPDWDKNIDKKVYLALTMNLFNGMQTKEKVVQAKSSLRKTQIQKETAERGIQLEVESCVNTWENAKRQIEIRKRQVSLAERNLELSEAAYSVGKIPQLDLLDANMSLRNAKLDYMSSMVDWNNAYSALLKATGEY